MVFFFFFYLQFFSSTLSILNQNKQYALEVGILLPEEGLKKKAILEDSVLLLKTVEGACYEGF